MDLIRKTIEGLDEMTFWNCFCGLKKWGLIKMQNKNGIELPNYRTF